MKIVYTSQSNGQKDKILKSYKGVSLYFNRLEEAIRAHPKAGRTETLLIYGKPCVTYKRAVKTMFFSGMLPDAYLWLSASYAIKDDNAIIVCISAHECS
jgi:hypothetical protein